ncbi:fluoride efflux transporter FluC [Micromonospora sp. NPDC049497]|uniref:fluoride efflux transporter FluC n=1 Tax=Micromonospora sp. NPDC049497 TaxID=3364273 RepID=UPI0037AF8BE8
MDPADGGRRGGASGPEARIDPDVDLRIPADRGELPARPRAVLGAVAAGGALGALARAAVAHAVPHQPATFAWSTFAVNVSGCLLIGALMAALPRAGRGRPLLRPFLGVGVLGGYTTFSTYAVDVHAAFAAGAPVTAVAYLGATVLGALLAVWLGDTLTGRLLGRAEPGSER